jgi:polyhydroxybutyrate depolymerase
VGELKSKLGVDPRRVSAAGFSNGGFMSHRLAAQASDVFAAVGVVEGTMGTKQDDGWVDIAAAKGPIPIAIMHGKQDGAVLYDGGTSANGHTSRSVAFAIERWTKTDGCTGKPTKQTLVPKKVVTTDYAKCTGDDEVLLYTLLQGAHEWPTVANAAGISASEELWKFFARHPKPGKLAKNN